MSDSVEIAGRKIGRSQPCFIIAEVGVNHNGDPALACQLTAVAAATGVDAVKFQTFRAEELASPVAPKAKYQVNDSAPQEAQLKMLQRLELSRETLQKLKTDCASARLVFLSTPFDETSADELQQLGLPAFKVSSGDVTHLHLLRHLAAFGKPILLSTGMSTLREIQVAIEAINRAGNNQIVLLHCVSSYPTAPADCNLRALQTMASTFGLPVGFSDHTLGWDIALAAVALGACVLEKHFTVDRNLPGPDHRVSLLPEEFRELVRSVRNIEAALGDGQKVPRPCEAETALVARRSLVAARAISSGTILRPEMIAVRRPGSGLAPAEKDNLVGRTTRQDIPAGALLTWDHLR